MNAQKAGAVIGDKCPKCDPHKISEWSWMMDGSTGPMCGYCGFESAAATGGR